MPEVGRLAMQADLPLPRYGPRALPGLPGPRLPEELTMPLINRWFFDAVVMPWWMDTIQEANNRRADAYMHRWHAEHGSSERHYYAEISSRTYRPPPPRQQRQRTERHWLTGQTMDRNEMEARYQACHAPPPPRAPAGPVSESKSFWDWVRGH